MSDFLPIPGYPGYAISAKGEVRSERGKRPVLLAHDSEGRVTLCTAGKSKVKSHVGPLLALAGYIAGGETLKLKDRLAEVEGLAADLQERLLAAVNERDRALAELSSAKAAKEAAGSGAARDRLREVEKRVADLERRLALAEKARVKAAAALDKARKANFLLLGIRANLNREIETLKRAGGGLKNMPGNGPKRNPGRSKKRTLPPADLGPADAEYLDEEDMRYGPDD